MVINVEEQISRMITNTNKEVYTLAKLYKVEIRRNGSYLNYRIYPNK
jgi:hypothetical protein